MKIFPLQELETLVAPYELLDVLESLSDNNLIEGYEIDYLLGEVVIDVSESTEIQDVMESFKTAITTSRKVTKQ